jgi:FAD/FMN-containing dehydrogenase
MSVHETTMTAEVLRPGDHGYDEATRVFFATGRPALVVRPRDPDEVGAALRYAGHHDLAVSVRSGGHSPAGHSTNDGGMVVDLAHLDAIDVLDADRRLVRVGGGATWGQVTTALAPHGWALTAGDTTSVGVGGLTLGGGIGWLVRRHGLAIDNLVGARVVTADGGLVTASADEHADLFWALRGGGGNFGVVVDFDFIAQEVTTVHHGTVAYQVDDAADLLRRWRDAMRSAPEELSSTLALLPAMPDSPRTAMVMLCYGAAPGAQVADADAAIEPLLELGTVTTASISERPYAEILEDAQLPPGIRLVSRNTLVRVLDDEVIEAIAGLSAAGGPRAIAVRSLGGAVARVPSDATAFAHRDAEVMVVCGTFLPETATDTDLEGALLPWHTVSTLGSGTYISFQGSATEADVAAAYPPATYARLAAVKRAYDPANLFALNHNVRPASAEEAEGPAA